MLVYICWLNQLSLFIPYGWKPGGINNGTNLISYWVNTKTQVNLYLNPFIPSWSTTYGTRMFGKCGANSISMFLTIVSKGLSALSCWTKTLRLVRDNMILVFTWLDQLRPRAGISSLLSALIAVVTWRRNKNQTLVGNLWMSVNCEQHLQAPESFNKAEKFIKNAQIT